MSTISIDLPNTLRARLEMISKESGVSISDLLVDAADKMSQMDLLEKIKEKAKLRDTRAGFERVLAAVPNADPIHPDDVIK